MNLINTGKVLEIKDGIISADGLSEVGYNEKVIIRTKTGEQVEGLVLNLEEDRTGIIVLGSFNNISEGDTVEATHEQLSLKVSDNFLGRVVNPLGQPLDGLGDIVELDKDKVMPLEKIAPGVIARQRVSRPVQTGIIAIDALTAIGRGQRQLIIGDRQTGKTSLVIDTILNQAKSAKEQGLPLLKCIYVAIGQKVSKVTQLVEKLKEAGAMEYTTVVLAGAADPASLQYIAPFTGTAIGEYFAEKGEDALIIYDDLTRHAFAYREISLLLRRPPGREAYPGDIFYLHSALLERSLQYSKENGGGSLTALPIIETQANDVSAYIPTNVISITDGQIFLETDLFNAGIRPAINVGISVSRVGGDAQIKGLKGVAGKLKVDLAQYRELAAFSQFGSDLDEATKKRLKSGGIMTELLKQDIYSPYSVSEEIMLIYAGNNGFLDNVEKNKIKDWSQQFLRYFEQNNAGIKDRLLKGEKIEGELEDKVKNLISTFNQEFYV